MFHTRHLIPVAAGALLLGSCAQEDLSEMAPGVAEPTDFQLASRSDLGEAAFAATAHDAALARVVDIDYDVANDYYVLTGVSADGQELTYYGGVSNLREWTQLPDNRSAAVTPGEHVGTAFADDGTFLAVSILQGRVAVQPGYTFSGAPRFNNGRFFVGDLVTFTAVEYDAALDRYVLTGTDAAGNEKAYYGGRENRRDWTEVADKFDPTATPGELVGLAYANDGTFLAVSQLQGKVAVQPGANFNQTPRFFNGRFFVDRALVEFLDVDYDSANDYYVLTGRTADGNVETYYGGRANRRDWTKTPDKYDAEVLRGTYQATAFNDTGLHMASFLFDGEPAGAVQDGYTFYNQPRFNAGKYILR